MDKYHQCTTYAIVHRREPHVFAHCNQKTHISNSTLVILSCIVCETTMSGNQLRSKKHFQSCIAETSQSWLSQRCREMMHLFRRRRWKWIHFVPSTILLHDLATLCWRFHFLFEKHVNFCLKLTWRAFADACKCFQMLADWIVWECLRVHYDVYVIGGSSRNFCAQCRWSMRRHRWHGLCDTAFRMKRRKTMCQNTLFSFMVLLFCKTRTCSRKPELLKNPCFWFCGNFHVSISHTFFEYVFHASTQRWKSTMLNVSTTVFKDSKTWP